MAARHDDGPVALVPGCLACRRARWDHAPACRTQYSVSQSARWRGKMRPPSHPVYKYITEGTRRSQDSNFLSPAFLPSKISSILSICESSALLEDARILIALMAPSTQRKTADALVAAFNNMDVDKIISFRSSDCVRYFMPASMGNKPQNNATYAKSLHQLRAIFYNFTLKVNDILEDKDARRLCMWMTARADTAAGEYINEYVWLLEFDRSGHKVVSSKEYSDTIMARDFFPKLQAAMKKHQASLNGHK